MNKEKIVEIGKYLTTKYIITRNVICNDKLDKQDMYIQLLYDEHLNLKIANDTLTKGIDELIEKYQMLINYSLTEEKDYEEFIQDLKSLKGEIE